MNTQPDLTKKPHSVDPVLLDELVFENENFILRKTCFWPGCSVWRDRETDLLKVLLPGSQAFNVKDSLSTFARPDGARATKLNFSSIDDFHEGLARVALPGQGYGFVDTEMNLVVQPQYAWANEFHNGFALVRKWDEEKKKYRSLFIDRQGVEYFFVRPNDGSYPDYENLRDFADGMFRVSDLDKEKFSDFCLAYFSDHANEAGWWGFVDATGKEIISPRYIFAYDFEDGRALVCRGEWTRDVKWNNQYNTGRYWSEEMLWGMIDKAGKEVVPCVFDEIKRFWKTDFEAHDTRYFQAHFGGWKKGAWGIIDASGNWVVEPIFPDLDYEISGNGCFAFHEKGEWDDPDNPRLGIYSIPEQRVLFEPQFSDIDLREDGTFKVEKFSEELGRKIEQIIDASGTPLWPSSYSYLWERKNYFEVSIKTPEGTTLKGAVDKQGTEIVPCKYDTAWDGLLLDYGKIVFQKSGKCGLMTLGEKVIIEPIYDNLRNLDGGFLFEAKNGGKPHLIDEGLVGLLTDHGDTVLPLQYERISLHKDLIIAEDGNGSTLFRYLRKP